MGFLRVLVFPDKKEMTFWFGDPNGNEEKRMTAYSPHVGALAIVAIAGALPAAQSRSRTRRARAAATPRMADGQPDLSGTWGAGVGTAAAASSSNTSRASSLKMFPSRRCAPNQVKCGDYTNQSEDGEFTARLNPNRPLYKPEFWDKVQQLDMWTNKYDPLFFCQPLGLPRAGRPRASSRPPRTSCFCMQRAAAARATAEYRVIPTDGRTHDPVKSEDVLLLGPLGRPLGRRHARHRLRRLQRPDVAGQGRLLHVVNNAGDRAFHAQGRYARLRSHC